ncbi:MAG TPA: tetratricopeptide repeat protein [Pyrinomonadaceae bacterium]|nr:tetratricopeptide repeat protein [Pyrinomonadaceae bacterium]
MKVNPHLLLPLLCAALLCALPAPPARSQDRGIRVSTEAAERRIALVIGNGSYATAPLKNPPNDASDMAAALSKVGFTVNHGTNLTQRQMKGLIREFGQKLKAGGQGLFYFAGHGVQLRGRNYLIPVDADITSEADVEDQGVDVNLVLGLMDEAGNGLNVIILDACRNNPFARSFRSASNGLAQVEAPTGTLVAYSTAPGRVARDGGGRNGAYTAELLKQMSMPGLLIEEVMKRVRASLKQQTKGEQVPWESSSLVGDFYFIRAAGEAASTPAPRPAVAAPNPATLELSFWESIKGSTDPEDYRAYLKKYPNGTYVPLAENSLRRLAAATAASPVKPPAAGNTAPPSTAKAVEHYDRGVAYERKGDYDLAVAEFSEAIRIEPGYARAYFGRGNNYANKRDHDRAIADYTEAIRLDPKYALVYRNRGISYANKGNFDRAIADYTEAIRLDPNDAAVPYTGRGVGYANKGDYDRAIADHTEAVRLDPKYALAYRNRGWGYANKADYDRAIADFTEAIRLDPNDAAVAYTGRGVSYANKGDYDRAITDYTEAIRLEPKYALAYRNRGISHANKGDYDRAIADHTEAIRLDPNDPVTYRNRALAYEYKGNKAQAAADRQKAKELEGK